MRINVRAIPNLMRKRRKYWRATCPSTYTYAALATIVRVKPPS
jgi:hypothetical protein